MTNDSSDSPSCLESHLIEILEYALYEADEAYKKAFDNLMVPLVEHYGEDKGKLEEIWNQHVKAFRNRIMSELDDKIDRPCIQDKWAQITTIDKSISENRIFLQEIAPLKSKYLSRLKIIKSKLTECREAGREKLLEDLKELNTVSLKKTQDEISQEMNAICKDVKENILP